MDKHSTGYLLPDSLLALASKDAIRRSAEGAAKYPDVSEVLEVELRQVLAFYAGRIVREFKTVDPEAGELAHRALKNVFESVSTLALREGEEEDEYGS